MTALNRDTRRSLVAITGGLSEPVKPDAVGDYGRRWTSTPVGTWEVNVTSAGVDVWTEIDPLTPKQAAALGDALKAAAGAS